MAVVDDSIVRGTTSRRIVRLLREAGATEVYFISSAPPIVSPCIYGIDMAMSTELIAANYTEDEICRYIEADKVDLPGFGRFAGAVFRRKGPRRQLLRLLLGQVPHRRRDPLPAPHQEERASHRPEPRRHGETAPSVSAKAPEPTEH